MKGPRPRLCFEDESCPSPKHHNSYLGYRYGCRSAAAILAEDAYRRGLDPKSALMIGVRRRLQALAVIGWSADLLAERAGCSPVNIKSLRSNKRDRCRMSTWRMVDQLYRDLSDTPGPSQITAQRARRAKWLPPIQWDDDVLDDPDGRPGHRARPQALGLTGDRHHDIILLTDADWTAEQIAQGMGITTRCVDKHRQRRNKQLRDAS